MEIKHIKYEIADRLSKIEANLGNRKYKDKQEYLKGAYFELEDLKGWIYERESKDSTSEQLEHDALLEIGGFAQYLINVGMRSLEYRHDDKTIYDNIEYFKLCKKHNLSAYKALLFLQDYIDGDYKF